MKRIYKIARNTSYFFLIYLLLSFLTISLYPVLIDNTVSLGLSGRLFYSLVSSVLLVVPSIFYVTRKTTGDYIDAVKIEELQISENEMKDAITNWVFAKHGKAVLGDVEISCSDPDAKILCKVNVKQD